MLGGLPTGDACSARAAQHSAMSAWAGAGSGHGSRDAALWSVAVRPGRSAPMAGHPARGCPAAGSGAGNPGSSRDDPAGPAGKPAVTLTNEQQKGG